MIEDLIEAAIEPGPSVDFVDTLEALPGVDAADVQAFIATHLPADRYIQVAVEPS